MLNPAVTIRTTGPSQGSASQPAPHQVTTSGENRNPKKRKHLPETPSQRKQRKLEKQQRWAVQLSPPSNPDDSLQKARDNFRTELQKPPLPTVVNESFQRLLGNQSFWKGSEKKILGSLKQYESKIPINTVDGLGQSALHKAGQNCKLKVIDFLLGFGAAINIRDKKMQSPLTLLRQVPKKTQAYQKTVEKLQKAEERLPFDYRYINRDLERVRKDAKAFHEPLAVAGQLVSKK